MINSNPLISIVVPVYNVEKYLDNCIESVINQTYKDFELILINDGSTDNSLQICNKWACKDNRVKVVNQQNLGVGKARNIGIENALGEYLYLLDSDDSVTIDFLEKIFKWTKKDFDVIIFGFNRVDLQGKIINYSVSKNIFIENLQNEKDKLAEILIAGTGLAVWDKVIKLNIIRKNNILFEKKINGEDFDFCIKIFDKSKILISLDKVYYNYRIFTSGKRNTNYNIVKNHAESFEYIRSFLINENKNDKIENYLNTIFLLWFTLVIPLNIAGFNKLSFTEKYNLLQSIYFTKSISLYSKMINFKELTIKNKILYSLFKIRSPLILMLLGFFMNKIRKLKYTS